VIAAAARLALQTIVPIPSPDTGQRHRPIPIFDQRYRHPIAA
jgi:hypothetical protein